MLKTHTFAKVLIESVAATVAFALIALFGFSAVEPAVSVAQAATTTSQFTTKLSITSEISFLTGATNIVLGSIGGITGGSATGSTQVRIYTNNTTGYTMTVAASGTPAMLGDSAGGSINDYTPSTANVPDFAFAPNSSGQAAEFGYTFSASTTADLAQKFKDNGSACNTGSADTSGAASCWYNFSTTPTSTIVTAAQTLSSGSTSTVFVRTNIPANPSPNLPKDTYTATTTLTATTNP